LRIRFVFVLGIALFASALTAAQSVHASILDVTNAEKLQLATSTPIGQKVRVSDGFYVSGTGSELDGFYVKFPTQFNEFDQYVQPGGREGNDNNGPSLALIRGSGGDLWQFIGTDGDWHIASDEAVEPWNVTTWTPRSGYSAPTLTHPAVQELKAASTSQTAVFVSGAGTRETNGIYTMRGVNDGKPYFVLLGAEDDLGVPIFSRTNIIYWDAGGATWLMIGSDNGAGSPYTSTDDVAFPWLATWVVTDGDAPVPTLTPIFQGELDAGVTVAGAGTNSDNGTYLVTGAENGIPIYQKSALQISFFDGGLWLSTDGGFPVDYAGDATPKLPWQSSWSVNDGAAPAPIVSRDDVASEANWILSEDDTILPTRIAFTGEPSNTSINIPFSVEISLEDDEGNIATVDASPTPQVTLFLENNPSGAHLSGTLTRTVSSGVATFDDLSIDKAGNDYTIVATTDEAFDIDEATSTSFGVTEVSHGGGGSGGGSHHAGGSSSGNSNSDTSPNDSTPPTNPPGCLPGYNFSATTGEKCLNNTLIPPNTTEPIDLPGDIPHYTFARDLTLGSTGEDVRELQKYLNTHGFPLAFAGAGSLGNETNYFGPLTQAALAKFQAANHISPSVGFFGSITRIFISQMLPTR
jgi:hypothetical protein